MRSNIAKVLVKHNEKHHLRGELLPEERQVYWVRVVTAFLRAGYTIGLPKSAWRECLPSHILKNYCWLCFFYPQGWREQNLPRDIRKECIYYLRWHHSPWESFGCTALLMDDDFSLQRRPVRVQMLSKSLTEEEIDRELLTVLSVIYRIHPYNLLVAVRDRESTNSVEMQTSSWISLFSHSTKSRLWRWK